MQPCPGPLALPLDWPLPDFTVYAMAFGPTSVTDRVAGPRGPLKGILTGSETTISQLPSAQAVMSRPSAADTEGLGVGSGRFGGSAFDGRSPGGDDDAFAGSSESLPQPAAAVRAISAASTTPLLRSPRGFVPAMVFPRVLCSGVRASLPVFGRQYSLESLSSRADGRDHLIGELGRRHGAGA
jgi:hypothetical protein